MTFFESLFDTFRKSDSTPANPSAPAVNNKPVNISHFRDETGVSTEELETGLWFITHRKHFIIAAVAVLGIISLITWSYSLYRWGDYLFSGLRQDKIFREQLVREGGIIHAENRATGYLTIGETTLILNADNTVDAVAQVKNTNSRGLLTFDYYFDINGQKVGAGREFVLPADSKYLLALNQPVSAQGGNATLVIENMSLQRLDSGIANRWGEYRAERLNVIVSDAMFVPGQISGLSEKLNLGEINFTIRNTGGYGYKEARLVVILKSGSRIVGATHYYLQNFRSGDIKTVRFTWAGSAPTVNQVEIIPDINLLDENIYLRYSL